MYLLGNEGNQARTMLEQRAAAESRSLTARRAVDFSRSEHLAGSFPSRFSYSSLNPVLCQAVLLQPWTPPSFLLPYLVSAFLLNPVGSAALTLVADYLRRVPSDPRFFWHHWWHFPLLASLTWLLTWYLNGGFEVFPGNPMITLLAVFTAVHLAWLLLTQYAARRKQPGRQPLKPEQPSTSS